MLLHAGIRGAGVEGYSHVDLDETLDRIEHLLEEGHPADARRIALKALDEHGDDIDLKRMAAAALWELEGPAAAIGELEQALESDEDSAELTALLADACFASARFEEAEQYARRALEGEEQPETLEVLSRLLERRGQDGEAQALMRKAQALDPEHFFVPERMSAPDFERCAEEALARLPEQFRDAMRERLTLMVEPLPTEPLLREEEPPLDPGILGLYAGLPLPEREPSHGSGALPDRIYLFQRNIERISPDRDTLVEEIAVTLLHEIGHFLGFDEEELEALDLA